MRIFPELATNYAGLDQVKVGFWERQFQPQRTRAQLAFDVIFGVIGPILCFVFDPVVFQSGLAGPSLFAEYQTFVYLLSGFEILLLCFWLVMGGGPEFSNSLIAGVLLIGAVFCLLAGFLLLPFSLIGLMIGVGVFGFTPFLTMIVYSRNAFRAFHVITNPASTFTRVFGVICGLVLVLSIPIALAAQIRGAVRKSVDEIVLGDAARASHAAQRLAVLRFIASAELDRIVIAYTSADEQRKEILRSSYRQITGQDIERRVWVYFD